MKYQVVAASAAEWIEDEIVATYRNREEAERTRQSITPMEGITLEIREIPEPRGIPRPLKIPVKGAEHLAGGWVAEPETGGRWAVRHPSLSTELPQQDNPPVYIGETLRRYWAKPAAASILYWPHRAAAASCKAHTAARKEYAGRNGIWVLTIQQAPGTPYAEAIGRVNTGEQYGDERKRDSGQYEGRIGLGPSEWDSGSVHIDGRLAELWIPRLPWNRADIVDHESAGFLRLRCDAQDVDLIIFGRAPLEPAQDRQDTDPTTSD